MKLTDRIDFVRIFIFLGGMVRFVLYLSQSKAEENEVMVKRWDLKDRLSEREKVVYKSHTPLFISRYCTCVRPHYYKDDDLRCREYDIRCLSCGKAPRPQLTGA